LFLVNFESVLDNFFIIVAALVEFAAAFVTFAFNFWFKEPDVVNCAAVLAYPP